MKIISLLLISTLPLLADVQTNITTGVVVTNLAAKIDTQIITNVVSGDNSSGCNICSANGPNVFPAVMNHVPCAPYKAPTERWTATNVIIRVTLKVYWNGKELTYSEDKPLTSNTNRWKLSTEWKKE